MAAPRPGDRIQIPRRSSAVGDDFSGGLCTVDGVYTPSIADEVVTRAGRVETPRVLKELVRGGSASTWISVVEDPGSWFEWEGYLEPNQGSPRPGSGERADRDLPVPPHIHTHAWIRPTAWAGAPADLSLSEWEFRVSVRGRDYIDVPVSAIEEIATRWDDLGTGFRIVIRGNTYRFWLLFPVAFGSRVPRWLRWAIVAGFSIGILLAIGWPTIGVSILACSLVMLGVAAWLAVRAARVERDSWLRLLTPTSPQSAPSITAVMACDDADVQLKAGRATEAVELYATALRADPRSARAQLGLGRAFARLGRLNDTAASFRRARALNPALFERELRKHGGSFGFNVDALLERARADSGDDGALEQGMAAVLEAGLRGGDDPMLDAAALLTEKRSEGGGAARLIEQAERTAASLVQADAWRAIQQRMQASDADALSAAAAFLVGLWETQVPRPSGEAVIGHAARLAEWVYAIGLEISIRHPELARHLMPQPTISAPRRGDVYSPVAELPGSSLYVVVSAGDAVAPANQFLVVPLTFATQQSRFQVPCRFGGREAHAVLDEMKTIHADHLERRVGAVDEESLATIEGGLRELFGN